MRKDPIVDEVRGYREQRAARFAFDIRAIAQDARQREARGGHKVVSLPPKQATVPRAQS
ncbi:MAG: hypothetical protein JXQ73_19690 [Phycisphaerae bacterium]|nr:hypothetical protein [Phycisphaerae bacterium]